MPQDTNVVVVTGRLTRDPEKRTLPSGSEVADFAIAIHRSWPDKQGEWQTETSFIDVSAFGRVANVKGCVKGATVIVEGNLKQERWLDSSEQQRSRVKIVAYRLRVLPSRPATSRASDEPAPDQTPEESPPPSEPGLPF